MKKRKFSLVFIFFLTLLIGNAIFVSTQMTSNEKAQLSEKVGDDQKKSYFMAMDEWKKIETERLQDPEWIGKYYRACFDGQGCRVPEPRKGKELNDYFKSLNLEEEEVYVMMQFENFGGDPSPWERILLKLQGVELIGLGGGGNTYFAKAPKYFLENKNYDFIRWIGIREFEAKTDNILLEKIYSCKGEINLRVGFYQKLNDKQIKTFMEMTNTNKSPDKEFVNIRVDIEKVEDISSLNFVKDVNLIVIPSICAPGDLNCGSNPFAGLVCN